MNGLISGPVSMHHVTTPIGKWLLVGEDHHLNGSTTLPAGCRYINDLLMDGVFESIWIEANDGQELVAMRNSSVKSPIKDMAARILDNPIAASKRNVALIDVRRRFPFLLLDSVVNFDTFYSIYAREFRFDYKDEIEKLGRIFTVCKAFEKQVFANLASRAKCKSLLMAFIDPNLTLPTWYQNGLDTFQRLGFHGHANENPIHACMRKLDPYIARRILSFAGSFVDMAIDNSAYSPAMNSVINTQANHASQMVAKKYKRVQDFFVILFSVLMDAYVLCRMFAEPKEQSVPSVPRVLLAGDSHIRTIMNFLLRVSSRTASNSDYSVYAVDGLLNMGHKQEANAPYLLGNPKKMLQSFRKRHKKTGAT